MQLFVDHLDADRAYTSAPGASWVHPSLPAVVLTGLFGDRCWLYHVEGGGFITAESLSEAPVSELDTLVVVAAGDLTLADPAAIDRMWRDAGGPGRRALSSGMISIALAC